MSEIINTQQALEQAAGNEELAKELFGMLVKELPELEEKLKAAIANQDMQACWDHAHKIYGSTAYCGVPALRVTAQAMENCVKTGNIGAIEENFVALNQAIKQILELAPQKLKQAWS